jgi:hypothetical protein
MDRGSVLLDLVREGRVEWAIELPPPRRPPPPGIVAAEQARVSGASVAHVASELLHGGRSSDDGYRAGHRAATHAGADVKPGPEWGPYWSGTDNAYR